MKYSWILTNSRIAISVFVIIIIMITVLLLTKLVSGYQYRYTQLPGISPPSSQDQQQLPSQQSQNSSSSSSSSNTSVVTFNDQQGRFSINYPALRQRKYCYNAIILHHAFFVCISYRILFCIF